MALANIERKYYGNVATGYDAKRVDSDKWDGEIEGVRQFLQDVPRGSVVLDMPVGTGHFMELYATLGLRIIGADISTDMLAIATRKIIDFGVRSAGMRCLDVRKDPLPETPVAVCTRFFNWLTEPELDHVLSSLVSPTRKLIIASMRFGKYRPDRKNSPHDQKRFNLVLADFDWYISDHYAITSDYFILKMEPYHAGH